MTSSVGIWPGYVGGTAGFRREVSEQSRDELALSIPAAVGAAIGAVLLFTTPAHDFATLAPYLVLAACALFALQPVVSRVVRDRRREGEGGRRLVVAHAGSFLASVYGGYFGAGLGVVLLALLGSVLPDELTRTNALRTVLSLVASTVAAIVFVVHGEIAWADAGLLAITSLVGGYLGAHIARRLPPIAFRLLVLALGLVTAVKLFIG